jgi:Tfp pilus assembly protein PilN
MRQYINLVNPALLPPKPFFQFRTMLLGLAAVALLLALLGVLLRYGAAVYAGVAEQAELRLKAREQSVQAATQRLHVRGPNPQFAQDLQAGREELARLQQISGSLPGQPVLASPAASLQALAAAVMPGVWLSEIELKQGQLSLRGYALRAELIPLYLERLRQQEAFRGQRFASFELGSKRFEAQPGQGSAEALEFLLQAQVGRQP